MKKSRTALFTALLLSPALHAAIVVQDPTLVTGADAIDPSGDKAVSHTPANATAQSILEGRSDFGAIQDFSGFTGNQSLSQQYIFNNTTAQVPDVQVAYTGSLSGTAPATTDNTTFMTSAGAGMRLAGLTNATSGFTFSFGTWDGTSLEQLAGHGVEAAGFTLTGRYGQINSVTVNYMDYLGNILNTQTIPNTLAEGTATAAAYTGYQITEGQNPIARIELSIVSSTTNGALFVADDLGFSHLVPEPSSALLVLGSSVLAVFRRRR